MKPSISQRLLARELKSGEDYMEKIYRSHKSKLFSEIKNNKKVLEIGSGVGVNLSYYPKNIKWTGIEPNPILRKEIVRNAKEIGFKAEVINAKAEKLPFKDNSFDYVVSTLVLCSVDVNEVLKEIKRVLKKRGKFIFIEHVADKKGSFRRSIQNLAAKSPWTFFGDGCRPNKDIGQQIKSSGFTKVVIEELMLEKTNIFGWVVKPHVLGYAEK